jgi:FkbM family methyltransferase
MTRSLNEMLETIRLKGCSIANMPLTFSYQGRKYKTNPERAALYHVRNSMSKLFRLASTVDRESSVIFDVGANCGIFAAMASIQAPKAQVIAFEPSEDLRPFFEYNCAGLNVELIDLAVSDQTGSATLYVNKNSQQTNSLVLSAVSPFCTNSSLSERKIECVTIDDFTADKGFDVIDVLKVDVQGAEMDVFRGARKTLPKVNTLLVESTWLDIRSVAGLVPFALAYGFEHAAVLNPVYMGADIVLSKREIKGDISPEFRFRLDHAIYQEGWL